MSTFSYKGNNLIPARRTSERVIVVKMLGNAGEDVRLGIGFNFPPFPRPPYGNGSPETARLEILDMFQASFEGSSHLIDCVVDTDISEPGIYAFVLTMRKLARHRSSVEATVRGVRSSLISLNLDTDYPTVEYQGLTI